jgi:hypothetical protein
MEFLLLKVLIGFIVGTLIGLTGLGGGVLLLPMLIFGLRVPAIIAVGTDALFNFFTKIPASIMHLRKGTVRKKVVLALASGSIPGSYLGVTFLVHLRHVYGAGVNDFIKSAVGLLLVLIPTLLLFGQHHHDDVAPVLFVCTQSHGRHRHCPCCDSDRRHQPVALAGRQRRSPLGRFPANRLDPRRNTRLASEHARSHTLATPNSVHGFTDDGSKNAVGLKSSTPYLTGDGALKTCCWVLGTRYWVLYSRSTN